MARHIERLKALTVSRLKEPGRYADGGGLYVHVRTGGSKYWVFRYMFAGKAHEMGLGSAITLSLAEARAAALRCRQLLHEGKDPIDVKKASGVSKRVAAAKTITFDECCNAYIKAHSPAWKSAKHAAQWANTLHDYVSPIIGNLPIQEVDTACMMKVLEPVWTAKTETASRVRARIENVISWASARGFRTGDNPARWRGHLDKLLPRRSKVQKVRHHAALPYAEIGAFVSELRKQEGIAARALEFTILTAARTGEVIGALWVEIDLKNKIWSIPAERMKTGKPHNIPLSTRALAILQNLPRSSNFIFGMQDGQGLSHSAMPRQLRRMGQGDITTHGFRSAFRDWSSEQTNYPREVCEMSLAHSVADKVEAAYRRGDLLEKRIRIMNDWSRFCDAVKNVDGDVIPIKGNKSVKKR